MPPRHALDLLTAFRMDVTKLRYENWDEVIHYCRYSAMPVGRFVLDVHGESRATWPASDALCAGAADQQSPAGLRQGFSRSQPRLSAARCAGGSRRLGRGARRAQNPRRRCCIACTRSRRQPKRCSTRAGRCAPQVRDFRLGLEVSVIQTFADKIVRAAEGARSPERARASVARSNCSRFSLAGMAGEVGRRAVGRRPIRRRRPAHDAETADQTPIYGSAASGSSFYAAMRILPRDAARGDVPDLQLLPPGRRHRRFRRPARRAARRAPAMARRHRRALSRASRRRG